MLPPLRTFAAKRYVEPLREGGSLPAVVDTEGGLFVVKFRGAGQGARALVAEVIAASVAEVLGLPTPELALVEVAPEFGRSEPDPEIQDLLRASHGINVGLRYLEGAFNFAAAPAGHLLPAGFATRLVWLDALLTNPDRTHRNTNLLVWDGRPWLIDHGAALYAHHDWERVDEARVRSPFPLIRDHVLLRESEGVREMDPELAGLLSPARIDALLDRVPDALLEAAPGSLGAAGERARYREYLTTRLREPRAWVQEAAAARERALTESATHLSSRR